MVCGDKVIARATSPRNTKKEENVATKPASTEPKRGKKKDAD